MPPLPMNNGHDNRYGEIMLSLAIREEKAGHEDRNETETNLVLNGLDLKEERDKYKGDTSMIKRHHLLRDCMTDEHTWDVLYNERTMSKEEKKDLLLKGL
jgi:hypothetical protein